MNERKVLGACEAALDGSDRLIAVGLVQPRGAGMAMLGGGVGGGDIGGLLGGWAESVGTVGGMLAGQAANAAEQGETRYMYLALSQSRIYLFARHGAGVGALLARFNRDEVGVEIHSRPLRRILVIEELRSGQRLALEAPRGPMFRDKTVLAMLHPDREAHSSS